MQDEPDPPRKVYGFKPREFDRANATPPAAPTDAPVLPPTPDPGIAPATGAINVHDLIRAGAGTGKQLGSNAVVNRPNEVHGMLVENLKKDIAAGHYDLGVLDDSKRRRRIRNYWIAMAALNVPLGAFALWIGHGSPYFFVFAIAAMSFFSARMTWNTFFLRTHY
jgi:hypothetical protein